MATSKVSAQAYLAGEIEAVAGPCTKCGKCVEVCPVVPHLRGDRPEPKPLVGGVVDFLRGAAIPADSTVWAQSCNGCGECVPACPEGINPRKLLVLANLRLVEAGKPNAALFKKLSRAIKVLVGMQLLPADFQRALGKPEKPVAPVVFYIGCNALRTPHLLFNSLEILDALDVDYEVVGGPAACCGNLHVRWMGELERGGKVTEAALAKFGRLSPEKAVIWCPSCYVHFADTFAAFRPPAFDIEHFAAFLAERAEALQTKLVRPVEKRVVLHAHTGRAEFGQSVARCLAAIPGLTLVDTVFESGLTCGGAGCDRCPPLKDVEHRKLIERVEAERADVLVTLYHTCHTTFMTAEKGKPFRVQNFTDLIVEALGSRPYADTLQRYRLADDARLVVEESAALLRLNGIDVSPTLLAEILPELLTSAEFRGGLECFAK